MEASQDKRLCHAACSCAVLRHLQAAVPCNGCTNSSAQASLVRSPHRVHAPLPLHACRDSARRSRLRKLAECEQLGVKVNTMESKRHELETALVRFQAAASKLEAHNNMLRKGIDLLNSHQRLPEGLRKAEADLAAALAKASRNLWEGPVHSEAEEEEEHEHDEDDGEGSEDASPQHTEGHNVNVQGMQGQEHHMPPGAAYSADPAAATGAAPAAASAAIVHNAAAAKAHSRGHGTAGMALKPDQHATTKGQAHPSATAGMHAAGSCHAHSKQQSPQHKAQHQKSTKGDGSHAAGRHAKAPGAAAETGGPLGSHVSASSLVPFGHGPNACAVVHGPQAGSNSGITSTTSGQYEGSAGFSPMTAHLLQIDTTSRLAPPALHGGVAAEPACMQPQSMQSTRHSSLERPLSTDTGKLLGRGCWAQGAGHRLLGQGAALSTDTGKLLGTGCSVV